MALPIDVALLPEASRKVLNGPAPMKMMAARGMAPLPPPAMVSVLFAFTHDDDEKLKEAAIASLGKLPGPVLGGALGAPDLHPLVLDALVKYTAGDREDVLEKILSHPALSLDTVLALAKTGSENVCELIATNEQKLLENPKIIETLYMNTKLRMSTADRICELAARNGLKLDIPAFEHIVAALQNQLIPEAGEVTPADEMFREAMEEAEAEEQAAPMTASEEDDVMERDEEGKEQVKKRWKKIEKKLDEMNVSEQIRVCLTGTAAQRAVLVRSPTRMVFMAAITSPKMQDTEAVKIAASRQVPDEVLRFVAQKREWVRLYETKKNLLNNPKTPIGISLQLLVHMRDNDVKAIAKSKNIAASLKTAAKQLEEKRKGAKPGQNNK